MLFRAAVAAVEPERLVGEAVGRRGEALRVRSVSSSARREFVFVPDRIAVLAAGKAAVPMARAADAALGSRIEEALVVARSADKVKAWDELMLNGMQPAAGKCDVPTAKVIELGRKLKVNGTPALIFENGVINPGYMPAAALNKALDDNSK